MKKGWDGFVQPFFKEGNFSFSTGFSMGMGGRSSSPSKPGGDLLRQCHDPPKVQLPKKEPD